jgi:hypothetical protein
MPRRGGGFLKGQYGKKGSPSSANSRGDNDSCRAPARKAVCPSVLFWALVPKACFAGPSS